MKEVELLRGETILAAVNELRYTGRKIADVLLLLSDENGDDAAAFVRVDEQLIIAENYLVNADHDLTDFAVLFVGLRVQRIVEAHGLPKVKRFALDFDDLSKILDEAKSVVVQSRADRANRIDIYDRLAKHHVPKLVELYKSLTSHPELKLPEGEIKKGLQLVTILTAIGVIAAIGTFLINLWFWVHYKPHLDISQIRSAVEEVLKAR